MGKTYRNNMYEDWDNDKIKTRKVRTKKKERQKNTLITKNLLQNDLDELE